MAVKVIIERNIKEGEREEVLSLLRELRTRALFRRGYVSGETLKAVDNGSLFTVISTWQTAADWQAWEKDPERVEIESKLLHHLTFPERVILYQPT